ncbi:transposable element Tcb2 transposase [Trichonephila clavipes]|nr:transposable element Tcb2 transposase [Trichonephila clavipes]
MRSFYNTPEVFWRGLWKRKRDERSVTTNQRDLPQNWGGMEHYMMLQTVVNDRRKLAHVTTKFVSLNMPPIPPTANHRRLRLQRAHENRAWQADEHKVVFSDESRFNLWDLDARIHVQCYAGERCLPECFIERHRGLTAGVMVWGTLSYHGRSNLLRIEGNLNSNRELAGYEEHGGSQNMWEPSGFWHYSVEKGPKDDNTKGARMQWSGSTVIRVWKQWTDEHLKSRKTGIGRWKVTSQRDDRRLLRMVVNDRTASSRQLAASWSTATDHDGCIHVERYVGKRCLLECVIGVMVWNAISYQGRSNLLQIEGNLNRNRNVREVSQSKAVPFLQSIPRAIFQQDNAQPHVSKTVRGFCSPQHMQLLP